MNNFKISGFADEISPNLEQQIRVLKENGISYIEIRSIEKKNVSEFSIKEAKEYKKILDEKKIGVSSIGSPIGKISINEPFEEHLERFKHVLKIAELFESPFIRMFSFYIDKEDNPDNYHDEVVYKWRKFINVANNYPTITLLHENEKNIYGDTPLRCLKLLKDLNNPKVRLAFDPANFVQCDVEVFPYVYEMLKDYISYVHIKDALFLDHKVTPAGDGDGEIKNVLENLLKNNYSGYLSLEPHLTDFEGFSNLEKENISISESKEKLNGEELFTLASDSLKNIIVNEMKLRWS